MKNFTKIFAITLTSLLVATASFAGTSVEKANELLAEGNNKAALTIYRKALKNADNASTNAIVLNMATAYANEGLNKLAEAQYRRLVRRNAANEAAKLQFAEILRKNNKLNEATEVLASMNTTAAKAALAQVEFTKTMVNKTSSFKVAKDVALNKVNFKEAATSTGSMFACK